MFCLQKYVISAPLYSLKGWFSMKVESSVKSESDPVAKLTRMVLKSPSRKFLKGVRKLMAALWINSRSAPPICFSVSPHFIRAFPVMVSSTSVVSLSIQHSTGGCTMWHNSLNVSLGTSILSRCRGLWIQRKRSCSKGG